MKWTSKRGSWRGVSKEKKKVLKVTAGVCAVSLLAMAAGASAGLVSPVSPAAAETIYPAPGVTISPIPLPTSGAAVPSLPPMPSIPSGGLPKGLPTSLPSGVPTGIPPIKTPDLTPKPAEDQPFTETNLSVGVGKTLTIAADASGSIQSNAFHVGTNVSGAGSGTVNVPVGPGNPRDVSSFKPLQVDNDSIVYDVNNQTPQVQNLVASVGQYTGSMPLSVTTRITQNGQPVDPNSATSLSGKIEIEWVFTNHTTSKETISYRGTSGTPVTETVDVSVPFGIGITGTFGKGWANVTAPWANTGFAVGQTLAGGVTLKDSSVVAKLSGTADNAQLPQINVKAVPKDSTSATSALYSKGAKIGGTVDDFLAGKGVPLLVKLQNGLGTASTEVAAFLNKNVNPILDMTSKLRVDPKTAEAKLAKTVDQVGQASDYLFLLNEMTENATAKVAGLVASATSPASQAKVNSSIALINGIDDELEQSITLLQGLLKQLPTVIAGLNDKLKSPDNLICPNPTKGCTGTDIVEQDIVALLPTSCTSGDATRTYLQNNAAAINTALNAAIAKMSNPANLVTLKNLLQAEAAGTWNASACQTAANGIVAATPPLIASLSEIYSDLEALLPGLQDVDNGLHLTVKTLTKLVSQMPTINYALDHSCSPAVITNISECGLIQAMQISSAADQKSATAVQVGLQRIENSLLLPMRQIIAVANDIGRGSLPLERALNDLPGVIDNLAMGPFGSLTSEAVTLEGLAANLTSNASKTAAMNLAIDKKFNTGEGFPYGLATGAGATTSATYAITLGAPAKAPVSPWVMAGLAGVLVLLMLGVAVWLSRRPTAV